MNKNIVTGLSLFLSIDVIAGTLLMTRPINNGRWGDQSPGDHHTYMHQRSVDVYVPLNSGTVHAVRLSSYSHHHYDDGFYFEVDWRGATCNGNVNESGETIKFIIYNNLGELVGRVAYSHLHQVPSDIDADDIFNWWSVPFIGYTKRWANGDCWDVHGDNAVHVHMEWESGGPYTFSEYPYSAYQTIDFGMVQFTKF